MDKHGRFFTRFSMENSGNFHDCAFLDTKPIEMGLLNFVLRRKFFSLGVLPY